MTEELQAYELPDRDVAFKLDSAEGKASDVRVVGSSLSERLDKASVQFIENTTFSTPCPSTTYEVQVGFTLLD
jgi:outer membrane biosynthesis protein TonB